MKYNHVNAETMTTEIEKTAKYYLICKENEDYDEWNAEEDFYDAVMEVAEKLNPEIDWLSAPQKIFDLVAQDREEILQIVKSNMV